MVLPVPRAVPEFLLAGIECVFIVIEDTYKFVHVNEGEFTRLLLGKQRWQMSAVGCRRLLEHFWHTLEPLALDDVPGKIGAVFLRRPFRG